MRSSLLPLALMVPALASVVACDKPQRPVTDAPATSHTPGAEGATASPPTPENAPNGPDPRATEPTAMTRTPDAVPPKEASRLASASNTFAFDLWKRAAGLKPGNLAVSPASISMALAMPYGGAKGETAAQMKTVLHFDADPGAQMTSWGKMSADLTRPSPAMKLRIANRGFADTAAKLEPSFVARTRDFGAPLETLDFQKAAEPSRARINGWVEEQTEHRIKDLLPADAIKPLTRLVLVNAIYFLADWQRPFDPTWTKKAPFTTAAKTKKDVDTMLQVESFPVMKADGVSVVQLAYKGGTASMLVILPDQVDGLDALERTITAASLEKWKRALARQRIELTLPRFEVSPATGLSLATPLQAMGMPLAFDRLKADFSGIANPSDPRERLHISDVFHKAFVKVDEKGTEAAAATAVVMGAAGGAPARPLELKVDHPFLFVIEDTASGLILFMGRVTDP